MFQGKMIRRYSKQDNSTNPALGVLRDDEQAPSENRAVIVYNNFNMVQFLAHAAGAEGEQEEDHNDNAYDDDDNDDANDWSPASSSNVININGTVNSSNHFAIDPPETRGIIWKY